MTEPTGEVRATTWQVCMDEAAATLREARMIASARPDVAKRLDQVACSWRDLAAECRYRDDA